MPPPPIAHTYIYPLASRHTSRIANQLLHIFSHFSRHPLEREGGLSPALANSYTHLYGCLKSAPVYTARVGKFHSAVPIKSRCAFQVSLLAWMWCHTGPGSSSPMLRCTFHQGWRLQEVFMAFCKVLMQTTGAIYTQLQRDSAPVCCVW